MNIYANENNDLYYIKYLNRSSEISNFLEHKSFLMAPKNDPKRDKMNNYDEDSSSYSFLDDNNVNYDFNNINDENYDYDHMPPVVGENYSDLNYSENSFCDENSIIVNNHLEEYPIDFITDVENSVFDSMNFFKNQDPPIYNDLLHNLKHVSDTPKRKRKQGVVGRPTLSSPQKLATPDNIYSHCSNAKIADDQSKYFSENHNYIKDSNNVRNRKPFCQSNFDEFSQRVVTKNRPRILSRPFLSELHYENKSQYHHIPMEPDAQEIVQREVANREFARVLVARAERQGTLIDKNKIPLSVFEQESNDNLLQSSNSHQIGELKEIKYAESLVTHSFSNRFNVPDLKKIDIPKLVPKVDSLPNVPQTASDILKKRKMDSRKLQ